VTLRVSTPEPQALASRVTAWLDQWVLANRQWKWGDQVFDFFDDFVGIPICTASGPDLLTLRFEGRPESKKWWIDWIGLRLLATFGRPSTRSSTLTKSWTAPMSSGKSLLEFDHGRIHAAELKTAMQRAVDTSQHERREERHLLRFPCNHKSQWCSCGTFPGFRWQF